MDWIERLFGVSPDGGDGSTELMYLISFVAMAIAWRWGRLRDYIDRLRSR